MNLFDVSAQTDSVVPMLYRIIFPVVGLIVLLLVYLVFRKSKGRFGSGDARPSGGLDLVSLKKKGLLTPEELERVGQSMLRQMKQKEEAEQRKQGIKSADALMLDPEVRRLEVMAAAKEKSEVQRPQATAPVQTGPSQDVAFEEKLQGGSGPGVQAQVSPADTYDAELDSIELPLDVQQLVDSGLLSDEEVRNVKRRLLERRRQQ